MTAIEERHAERSAIAVFNLLPRAMDSLARLQWERERGCSGRRSIRGNIVSRELLLSFSLPLSGSFSLFIPSLSFHMHTILKRDTTLIAPSHTMRCVHMRLGTANIKTTSRLWRGQLAENYAFAVLRLARKRQLFERNCGFCHGVQCAVNIFANFFMFGTSCSQKVL